MGDALVTEGRLALSFADPRAMRLFKGVLQSLAKISPDLMLEAKPSQLRLAAVNTAQSACLTVGFGASSFHTYDLYSCDVLQCGLAAKQLLSVFRTQHVHCLSLEVCAADGAATVSLQCDNGLNKSYGMPTLDSEFLSTAIDEVAMPSSVVADTAALSKLLSSFHTGLEEITLVAHPAPSNSGGFGRGPPQRAVQLRSFLDAKRDLPDRSLYTELAVDTSTLFVSYRHDSDQVADVTFSLRDFRVLLPLCESLSARVKLSFAGPGSPIIVRPYLVGGPEWQLQDFEAQLVMATLLQSYAEGPSSPQRAAAGTAAGANAAAAPRSQWEEGRGGVGVQREASGLVDDPFLDDPGHHQHDMPRGFGRRLHEGEGGEDEEIPGTPPEGEPAMYEGHRLVPGVIALTPQGC